MGHYQRVDIRCCSVADHYMDAQVTAIDAISRNVMSRNVKKCQEIGDSCDAWYRGIATRHSRHKFTANLRTHGH